MSAEFPRPPVYLQAWTLALKMQRIGIDSSDAGSLNVAALARPYAEFWIGLRSNAEYPDRENEFVKVLQEVQSKGLDGDELIEFSERLQEILEVRIPDEV